MFFWLAFGSATTALPQFRPPWMATPEEAKAQSDAAMATLGSYLNELGYAQLAKRAEAMKAVATRPDAERRQAAVRQKIASLVGGIPKSDGPVVKRTFGTARETGFTIERIAFQSCPDYWVTANVYVPEGRGPFPAMVITVGHGGGKEFLFSWGATLARAGVLVLAYDPMGQGERLQHFDRELGDSKLERLGEHEHANQSALLIGQSIARYWFADGMRAVDYLVERRDVDPARIGTFGCSGGGTAAAYLAAMDPRIAVAVVSSFITSFRELLPGNGPQDAEQTLPRFIAAGLDFADWVELAAPRPYAIVAYEHDFFPIAGAAETFAEARDFYARFDATANLTLVRGPGGHCNLPAVMPEVLGFLMHHLQGPGAPIPAFENVRPRDQEELIVTPKGQVSTSLGGKTVEDLVRENLRTRTRRAERRTPAPETVDALRERLRRDIHLVAGTSPLPDEPPPVRRTLLAQKEGYQLQAVEIQSEPGITLAGRLALPSGTRPRPTVLWMDAQPLDRTVTAPAFVRLVETGHMVLALHVRGVLGEPDPHPDYLALGQYMSPALRAIIVGRTLIGMRVDDACRAIAWLATLDEVDRKRMIAYGRGAQGLVALHAAVLDPAITEVIMEDTLVSYRAAAEAGLHRDLCELVLPGVLNSYDTDDLLRAISPRPATIVNPVDAMGHPLRLAEARSILAAAFTQAQAPGQPERILLSRRDPRDPLPGI